MKAIKLTTAALLAGIALTTAAVHAADAATEEDARPERGHHMRAPSLERMAIGNAMAAELATRTGRSADEIGAMLKNDGPRKTAETLGLDRDAMKEAMRNAREKVITQAAQAQLITAEQAQTLKDAPMARVHVRKSPGVRIEAPDAD